MSLLKEDKCYCNCHRLGRTQNSWCEFCFEGHVVWDNIVKDLEKKGYNIEKDE